MDFFEMITAVILGNSITAAIWVYAITAHKAEQEKRKKPAVKALENSYTGSTYTDIVSWWRAKYPE